MFATFVVDLGMSCMIRISELVYKYNRVIRRRPYVHGEKKLIGWRLGIGIGLLIVLVVVNHLFPADL